VGLLSDASGQPGVYDLGLALLNVLQTVALAYLAADRHNVTRARKQGYRTRSDDSPGTSA
jgi:hypothetical protein